MRSPFATLLVCAATCASPSAPAQLDVSGNWSGTGSDQLGPETFTLTLAQSGNTLRGSTQIKPVNADDGSCVSCHKSKIGSVGGTVYGTTIRLTMFFASGAAGDPTPVCSITLVGEKGTAGATTIAVPYTATDPCEGTLTGTISLSRTP